MENGFNFDTSKVRIIKENVSANRVEDPKILEWNQYLPNDFEKFDESQFFVTKVGKTAVEGVLLNPGQKDVNVMLSGWGSDLHSPIGQIEIQQVANHNPDKTILAFSNPSSGRSSEIPKNVMREIKKENSFLPYGEMLAEAIDQKTFTNQNLEKIFGFSLGGRLAIASANYLGPEKVHVVDPPGSKDLGLLKLAKKFIFEEGKLAEEYLKYSKDKNALKIKQEIDHDSLASFVKNILNMSPNKIKDLFIDQTTIMSKAGLEHDLRALAETKKVQELLFSSPTLSRINNPEEVLVILKRIAQLNPDMLVIHNRLEGLTHAIGAGGQTNVMVGFSKLN